MAKNKTNKKLVKNISDMSLSELLKEGDKSVKTLKKNIPKLLKESKKGN